MTKINILYIGRNPEILETVVRLLNKNEEWHGVGAQTDEQACRLFAQIDFDIVLLGPGIEEDNEVNLCAFFRQKKPAIIIVAHYGGGSGLLASEIYQALHEKS